MYKFNLENEKVKRNYLEWLDGSPGFGKSTILYCEHAINLWEDFTKNDNFKNFNYKLAKEFKKWLSQRKDPKTKKLISLRTRHNYLQRLNKFFRWLAALPGYKTRILLNDVAYLNLNRQERKIAEYFPKRKFPELRTIVKVINSIKIVTEVDKRDQALIALTLLTGARAQAIISLSLECIDPDKQVIYQRPDKGVKTKFSKNITTHFFKFDGTSIDIVKAWVNYLKNEKNFTGQDPLFPSTRTETHNKNHFTFISNTLVPTFWRTTGSMRKIFRERFEQAGEQYFYPHTIRHSVISIAIGLCKTPAEFKAVSQNLGHEKLATTFFDYATMPSEYVESTIKNLGKHTEEDINSKMLKQILDRTGLLLKTKE